MPLGSVRQCTNTRKTPLAPEGHGGLRGARRGTPVPVIRSTVTRSTPCRRLHEVRESTNHGLLLLLHAAEQVTPPSVRRFRGCLLSSLSLSNRCRPCGVSARTTMGVCHVSCLPRGARGSSPVSAVLLTQCLRSFSAVARCCGTFRP